MKIRFLPLFLVALALSVATGEAKRHRSPAGAAAFSTRSYGGGGLAQERGLSQGEASAAGVVLGEISGARATAGPPPVPPSRRYSPDYYRVYPLRMRASAAAKRVATAPKAAPAPKGVAVAAQPTPAKLLPLPAPRVAKLRVVAAPKPAPVTPAPVAMRRVAGERKPIRTVFPEPNRR
ncbi:MAG: hypothetical protein WCF18_18165 [Chthoniobacteraceae bacterium]